MKNPKKLNQAQVLKKLKNDVQETPWLYCFFSIQLSFELDGAGASESQIKI